MVLSLALVGYGAWLNYSDENQIARRMDNRAIQLTGAKASYRELQTVIPLPAVRFSSTNMADAIALTDGRVGDWLVHKNTHVNKGDVLVSMANEQIPLKIQQANSAVQKAEAVLANAYSSYQRQERLKAKNATSQEKYEAALSQYLAAKEALKEAQAQREQYNVQKNWLAVRAPVDGDVLLVYQRTGTYVQPGTPLALVGNFDKLTFSLNLPDINVRNMAVGDSFYLTLPDNLSLNKAYDTNYGVGNQGWEQKIHGVLTEIVPDLSEPADVRRTVWEIDNRTRIIEPMTYTELTLFIDKKRRCLTVPMSAMVDSAHDKVYVVDSEGILHTKNIVAGANDGTYIEICEGLAEGDVVVIDNPEGLADGLKTEVILEGSED